MFVCLSVWNCVRKLDESFSHPLEVMDNMDIREKVQTMFVLEVVSEAGRAERK